MELSFMDHTGARIRYYRTKAGMTQKELAGVCGLSEPAIRNYELENRIPSFEVLKDIADALHVNFYALADPQIPPLGGSLHILFRMEQAFALSPVMIDGKVMLQMNAGVQDDMPDFFEQMLMIWEKAHELLENGVWTLEEYQTWQSIYPYTTKETTDHPLSVELQKYMAAPKLPEDRPDAPVKRKPKPKKGKKQPDN